MIIKLVCNFFNKVFGSLGGWKTHRYNKRGDRLIDNKLLLSKLVRQHVVMGSVKMTNAGKQD
jgi:hypothetical protein